MDRSIISGMLCRAARSVGAAGLRSWRQVPARALGSAPIGDVIGIDLSILLGSVYNPPDHFAAAASPVLRGLPAGQRD